jgi:hypothetical protein
MKDAEEADCPTCLDTGYVCLECGEADGECTCDEGPDLTRCEDCAPEEE